MKAGLADLKNATSRQNRSSWRTHDQAADSPARKTYTEGLDTVIKQVDDANALIDAGKLDEAKAAIKEINTTRKTYHKKLGVWALPREPVNRLPPLLPSHSQFSLSTARPTIDSLSPG